MTLTFDTVIISISCLHLPTFRSQDSKVSVKTLFSIFSRVTDEALIAETMVWPYFFRMNVFFVLKGSKFLILFHIEKPKLTSLTLL